MRIFDKTFRLSTDLSKDTRGRQVSRQSMKPSLAELLKRCLPDRGEQFYIPERLRTLWDREWVMYLLVAILSVEWLTRKLLKLA